MTSAHHALPPPLLLPLPLSVLPGQVMRGSESDVVLTDELSGLLDPMLKVRLL